MLPRAEQYARGDWSLIALKMVQVGAGHAELLRHLALVEAALASQA
jgi:hypothetical protein